MLSQTLQKTTPQVTDVTQSCAVAVIWIDWYAYHVGRFRGMQASASLQDRVRGIELVGGVGVHAGLKFREPLPEDVSVETLMPGSSWHEVSKSELSIKLWKYLTQLDPDVVLVPGYYTLPGITAAVWAKLNQRKSVLMTESTADDHQRVWYKEWFKGFLINTLFDWAVTGGKAHVRYLRQLGFVEDRIANFYDVVDNRIYRDRTALLRNESPSNYGLPSPYFIYIGRLAPEKNIEGLIAAWLQYRQNGGTWPLVLVGDGPSSSALRESAAASTYAQDIHFAGQKSSEALPTYYAFAGCFVLPSTREPWGLVVNEAMASGLPVIVSDRCGCAEDLVVHGVNGFIFNPFDQGQLAQCLTAIEALGETGCLAMGKHSSSIISGYTSEKFGDEIARLTKSE
jgi:1,2-diacylglycerol 3-alpha-glucosyltransferase